MSEQDKQNWDALYQYVRSEIMGYDMNQSLSRNMSLRLKGLCTNKYIENSSIEDTAHYPYSVVLNTFKYCSLDIRKALQGRTFANEQHKFNYILKIVESNLNTVYMRMKSAEKSKAKTETVDVSVATYDQAATYQRKTTAIGNKRTDELW